MILLAMLALLRLSFWSSLPNKKSYLIFFHTLRKFLHFTTSPWMVSLYLFQENTSSSHPPRDKQRWSILFTLLYFVFHRLLLLFWRLWDLILVYTLFYSIQWILIHRYFCHHMAVHLEETLYQKQVYFCSHAQWKARFKLFDSDLKSLNATNSFLLAGE